MDKKFWEERYESDSSIPSDPSLFAKYCLESGKIKPKDVVLEIGHGNGRDAFFFAKNGIRVIGIDQAGKTWVNAGKLRLMHGDFTSGPEVFEALFKTLGQNQRVNHVYSRFTWHSISHVKEDSVIKWLPEVLKPGGSVLIECRTTYDDMCGLGKECLSDTYIFEDHRRRFINPGKLVGKLLESNFCVTSELSHGFAPYKNKDPIILRVEAVSK